ncbi:ankyrin [Neocallimastix sp. 'constans']
MEGLKQLIKKDAINEIKSYVSLNKVIDNHEIKNSSFDLLIYTIKYSSSIFTLKYIISVYQFLYKNLNYTLSSGESPLAVALAFNKFIFADYLRVQKADINFRNGYGDNILAFLYKKSLLTDASLKYLLRNKVEVDTIDRAGNSFLTLTTANNNVSFSRILHKTFDIFHKGFILKLLFLSKFQRPISYLEFRELFKIERENLGRLQIKDQDIINSCLKQNLDIIKLGFSRNINKKFFNRIDISGLLEQLYEEKKFDILKFLVKRGALLPTQMETYDHSLFIKILYHKDLEMAKFLISKGLNVNNQINWNNRCYPYIYFVSNDNDEFYKLLIKHGADLYITDSQYNKILKITNSNRSVAEYLTKNKCLRTLGYENYLTFYSACSHGNIKILKHLLQAPIPVSTLTHGKGYPEKPTPLAVACMKSQEKVVKILLDHGALIAPTNSTGKPLYSQSYLMMACECNNEKIIEYLIQYGADISEINSRGETLLIFACKNKYETIAHHLLLTGKIDVHAQDHFGNTALTYSCQNGLVEIVKILLEHQVDLNVQNENKETSLILACKNRYPTIVKLLIRSTLPLNPNLLDKDNRSPLMYTLMTGNTESINDLLSLDQTLNKEMITTPSYTPSENNKTLLMYACQYGTLELVKILVNHHHRYQVQLNKRNDRGETALHYACRYGNDCIVEYLFKEGASINDISNNGDTTLIYAIKGNKIKIVNSLLQNGVNWRIRNNEGETAMMIACQLGYHEIVKYLIEEVEDIKVDEVSSNGDTSLIYACHYGHKECVQYLLKKNCNIDYKGYKGKTALIHACENGKLEVMKLLLSYRPNINIRDYQGKTALIYARENNYPKIIFSKL